MKRFVKNLIFMKIFKQGSKGYEEPRGRICHMVRWNKMTSPEARVTTSPS